MDSNTKINKFNIRVYGILIHKENLLLTDEFRLGTKMTKFPGGALNFGEGTIDCLKREFIEELNLKIDVTEHLYTTDYFQPTNLLPVTEQLISIYYIVKADEPFMFKTTDIKFDFKKLEEGAQTFRWLPLKNVKVSDFTLPIDKRAASLLLEKIDKYLHLKKNDF